MGAYKLLSHHHFGSVSEAWAYANRPLADGPHRADNAAVMDRSVDNYSGASCWHGMNGGAKAVEKTATEGWPEGAKRVKALAEKIRAEAPQPKSIRRRVKWADQGDALDITRVWSGRLETAWESHPRQSRTGIQSLTIGINLSQNAGTGAETYFWRGAAALALADVLTEAGYNVGILGVDTTLGATQDDSYSTARSFTITIKPQDAPLDLNALASSACLAGFFRVALFRAIIQRANDLGKRVALGLGRSPEGPALDATNALLNEKGWTWDLSTAHIETEKDAVRWVKAAIENIELGQLAALAAL